MSSPGFTKRTSFYFFQSFTVSICLLLCFLFLSAKTVAAALPGSLDTSFGTGGKVLTPFPNLRAYSGSEIALQADGKIVMACNVHTGGFGSMQTCLARFNANGTLDTSFGTGGRVSTILPGDTNQTSDFTTGVAIQSDGKIVVIGWVSTLIGENYTGRGIVLRYNADGSLDTGFDGDGIRFIDSIVIFGGVKIQPDGKIVAAGYGTLGITIVRFNSNGSLDTSFDGDGMAGTETSNSHRYDVGGIALQPDGKIVVSGTDDNLAFVIIRHNPDGSRDMSFDNDGIVTLPFGGTFGIGANCRFLLIQPDGKIVIGGYAGQVPNARTDIVLARYNSNGSPDNSFDGDGKVVTHFSPSDRDDEAYDLALQPDGKIIVLANLDQIRNAPVTQALWGLLRYNADGSLDSTFGGGDGVATTTVTGTEDFASSMLLQPDGKLLVNGRTGNPGVFALLRFNTKAQSPFDFDGDGKTDLSIYRPSAGQWWILKSANSENNVFTFGTSSDKIVPGDYTGDGKTDVAVWRPATGEWFILRSEDYSYYAFPFGLNGDKPLVGDFDGDAKADPTIYRPSNNTWYVFKSTGGYLIQQFGTTGDVPVPADYDGDGKADVAIYRPSQDTWWLNRSTDGLITIQWFIGLTGEKPVTGDFTGDGRADCALFSATGAISFVNTVNNSGDAYTVGVDTDIPATGDYDGDGITDAAVFRPSTGTWRVRPSSTGTIVTQNYGISTDKPVPSAFLP